MILRGVREKNINACSGIVDGGSAYTEAVTSSSNLVWECRTPGFDFNPVYARILCFTPFKLLYGNSTSMILDCEERLTVTVLNIMALPFLFPWYRNLITNSQSAAGYDVMTLNFALKDPADRWVYCCVGPSNSVINSGYGETVDVPVTTPDLSVVVAVGRVTVLATPNAGFVAVVATVESASGAVLPQALQSTGQLNITDGTMAVFAHSRFDIPTQFTLSWQTELVDVDVVVVVEVLVDVMLVDVLTVVAIASTLLFVFLANANRTPGAAPSTAPLFGAVYIKTS